MDPNFSDKFISSLHQIETSILSFLSDIPRPVPLQKIETQPKLSEEQLTTQASLVRMFLAKSQHYNHSMSSWTLKQWLFYCFLTLKKHPQFPLSQEMALLRLQEILSKKVKARHHLQEVFGEESKTNSIQTELNILIALSRNHHFFDWKIYTICSSPDPSLLKEKYSMLLPFKVISEGIMLFESSLFSHLKSFQEILINCEQSYQFLDHSLNQHFPKKKDHLQPKVTRHSFFAELKQLTSVLERFYRSRICPLLSLIHQWNSNDIFLEKKRLLLTEIIRSIQIFLPFQKKIEIKLKKQITNFISLLGLHQEQQDEVKTEIRKCTLSDDPKNLFKAQAPFVDPIKEIFSNNLRKYDEFKDLEKFAKISEDLCHTLNSLTIESQNKKQREGGLLVGSTEGYIKLAKERYVTLTELKNSLNGIDSFVLEFISQNLKDILKELTVNQEQEVDNSWLELLDDHHPFQHPSNISLKPKLTNSSQNEISSESDDENKIDESLILIFPHIPSKSENEFQIGVNLLDQLKKTCPQDAFFYLTSSIEWISSLVKKPLVFLKPLDNYKIKRIQIAQSEASDQVFLSASAFEWLESHAKQGDVFSALVSVRPLVMSWHVMIEQTLFIKSAKDGKIPHSHHLTDLIKSQNPIFQELDYALIWSRYPFSSLKRYGSLEKAPFALQWILKADRWMAKLSSGEKWSMEDHQLFIQMMQAITRQHEKALSCFITLLGEEDLPSKEKELVSQIYENVQKILQKINSDYPFPKSEKELVTCDLLKKIEQAVLTNPKRDHLIEVAAHVRRLLILSRSRPNGHLIAWQASQWIHLQWAIEHAFLDICQTKELGFVQSHDFDYFQEILSDYTQTDEKPFSLDKELQEELKQLNVAKGVHYPHLAIWEGFQNQILTDWVHLLQTSREQIRTQGWETQRKKHSEKSLIHLQKHGITILAKLMDYILK